MSPTLFYQVMHMNDNGHTSIILEHDILRGNYIPFKLKGRETQTEQILCCLSPAIKRHKPIHTWLYGKPGSGKTATAISVLRLLEEKHGVRSIIINCWEKHTFYQILDAMISDLRILRAEGNRTSFKLEKIRSYLKEHPFIVLLDEVDQIKPAELSTILYNLDSMLNAGLVCISDSTAALHELEERVRSRLNPHTVFFPRYTRTNLLEILRYRAELALAENSWSHTALRRIASMAQGDARVAIRMLRRAAMLADHHQVDRITTTTLAEQIKAVKKTRETSILNNLTQDHRILYKIIKRNEQILSGDLWHSYLEHCSRIKRKPLASRTFSDYMNRLVQTGLISSERARVKGKVRLFKSAA